MRVDEVMRNETPIKKDMQRVEGVLSPITFFRVFTDFRTI